MNMKEIKVRVTFTEEVLGSSPSNPDIYRDYIASRSPDAATIEEEVAAVGVDEVAEKQMTIFPKLADGTPFVYDYQVRGFFKEVLGILKKVPGSKATKIKAHKKLIDNFVFVEPRSIPLNLHGMKIDICQRPLRASTPMGERTALAMSETVPEGTSMEFTVLITIDDKDGEYEAALVECLDYGRLKGFGQWRNSGKGKFTYELI